MPHRPPLPTLFPYTTLFRSARQGLGLGGRPGMVGQHEHRSAHLERSEEHTSELQSRGHLVCRLLLDKKKTEIDISASSQDNSTGLVLRGTNIPGHARKYNTT